METVSLSEDKKGGFSQKEIDYILNVGNNISEGKLNLIKETQQTFPDDCGMLTFPPEGEFLKMLVQLTSGKKGIEIGVFTGYSALCLAEGLPSDGKLLAFDISEEFTKLAKKHWKLNSVSEKIELVIGDAVSTLKKYLEDDSYRGTFDFAYVDADKGNYDNYYEILIQLIKPSGFIIFDNTLWSNKVVHDEVQDTRTVALRKLNLKLRNDDRVSINQLNIADGVTIVRKK